MNTNRLIWDLIKDLLYTYDCVIVPGFGGFVCNREPARIDQVSHVILPPGKRIVFNQNLKTNDGLLAGMLAQKASITYSEAISQIDHLVSHLVDVLQEKKQYSIDAFGSFRLNAEANYVFLPDKQNNFLHTSFGLEPIQAEFVSTGYAKIKRTRIFRERSRAKTTSKRRVRKLGPKLLVAALTIMLMVNGWIFLNPSANNGLNLDTAGLHFTSWFDSVFNKSEQPETHIAAPVSSPVVVETVEVEAPHLAPKFVPEINIAAIYDSIRILPQTTATVEEVTTPEITEPVQTEENNKETYVFDLGRFGQTLASCKSNLYIPGNNIIEEPALPVTNETAVPTNETPAIKAPAQSGLKYFIIGGVFCKQKNALHFKQQLENKGYRAELVVNPEINCQRVSYASFINRAEAEQKLHEIQSSENPSAWLLESGN